MSRLCYAGFGSIFISPPFHGKSTPNLLLLLIHVGITHPLFHCSIKVILLTQYLIFILKQINWTLSCAFTVMKIASHLCCIWNRMYGLVCFLNFGNIFFYSFGFHF